MRILLSLSRTVLVAILLTLVFPVKIIGLCCNDLAALVGRFCLKCLEANDG